MYVRGSAERRSWSEDVNGRPILLGLVIWARGVPEKIDRQFTLM